MQDIFMAGVADIQIEYINIHIIEEKFYQK